MHPIDWTIVAIYLIWIVWDGLRRTRRREDKMVGPVGELTRMDQLFNHPLELTMLLGIKVEQDRDLFRFARTVVG